ncbi:hypothetical protein GQF61_16760 [Sphingobacterium sp. DK4209]|uniref:Uncharacterized protein n=1 Tax=Sphingobacterium zhuxiongii TaxID=2662364 RepID=A0A5Q0Q6C5_9SPHI|nr:MULTISPECIES: hypothetical protein [unclassified Sphingobacterium]MVZ67505.1 hypothetical protein [Sphingobacterium sp. DK4209]QGA24906.1 hypothetical protein GFH32_00585 [Sphingobacterium sp. dk4302]
MATLGPFGLQVRDRSLSFTILTAVGIKINYFYMGSITYNPDGTRFRWYILNPSWLKEKNVLYFIELIKNGESESPLMAAACAVWRKSSALVAGLYSGGGFTGESYMFLDNEMFSSFCRTSYGPPIENMQKIRSLLRDGIIRVQCQTPVEISYDSITNQFLLVSENMEEMVEDLVEAYKKEDSLPEFPRSW